MFLEKVSHILKSHVRPEIKISYSLLTNIMSCKLCNQMLNNAVITDCGHSFCDKCINFHLTINRNKKQCPICHKAISLYKIFPNFAIRKTKGKIKLINIYIINRVIREVYWR